MPQKLMILGAGPFQLPGIQKAVRMGCHVITIDNLPGNVGHRFSHESHNCSTTDLDGVLEIAKRIGLDGICSFSSDVAVPTVGYVAEQLGLSAVPYRAARIMANKASFRVFMKVKGLSYPDFVVATTFDELKDAALSIPGAVVIKPVDSSGSRGVVRLEAFGEAGARQAFDNAKAFSRTGAVCLESFLAGVEIGGDAVFSKGRILFCAITCKHRSGFIVTGHSLPPIISEKAISSVKEALAATCQALGYTDGPLNFDVIIDGDIAIIIEMSPRNGGNGIPAVISRATGYDVERQTLLIALGQAPEPVPSATTRGAGSLVFGSPSAGLLRSVADKTTLKARVPEVFELSLAKRPGDRVEAFVHNGNMIGYALFDCPRPSDYDKIAARIHRALKLAVD